MRFAMIALVLHFAVSSLSPSAFAQVPTDSVRRDTTASDSARTDSLRGPIHPWWGPLLIPAGVVFMFVMAAAPAPLARWVNIGPVDMTFMKNHAAFHASVGGRFTEGETWANALSLEIVHKPLLVELQAEDFWRPQHIRYFTARVGYLWHPKRAAAGGLTIGYVHAEGATSQTGLEVGLPLFIGREKMTMRFEPTYVRSSTGLLWGYRGQAEIYLAGGRYVVGANLVRKSVGLTCENEGPQAGTVMFGVRF